MDSIFSSLMHHTIYYSSFPCQIAWLPCSFWELSIQICKFGLSKLALLLLCFDCSRKNFIFLGKICKSLPCFKGKNIMLFGICFTGDWIISRNHRKGFKGNLPCLPFHLNIVFTTLPIWICCFEKTLLSNDGSELKELLINSQNNVLGSF